MGVHIQKFKKSFTITYIYALKAPRACRICGSLQWLGREEMRNSYDENCISNSMFGVEKKNRGVGAMKGGDGRLDFWSVAETG